MNFYDQWEEVPDNIVYENGFKLQWEEFIKHLFCRTPWRHDLAEGAKGVQLAELGLQSWAERRWLDVPPLDI
jgi:predicted dehydrogenase